MKFHAASPFSSRRRRQALRLLLIASLAWLVFSLVRARQLLANARHIEKHSAPFARDYFVGNRDSPPLTYLVLGDSTAAGWGADTLALTYPHRVADAVAARGYRVRVVNRAVGGARLRDVIRGQLPSLPNVRADLVTLSFGANDATHVTAQADYARDLQFLVSALETSGARLILLADTPDMYRAPALPLPLAMAINRRAILQNRLLDDALSLSKIRRIALYERGKLNYQTDKNLYAADLFHPSGQGYEVWARLFIEEIGSAYTAPHAQETRPQPQRRQAQTSETSQKTHFRNAPAFPDRP